MPKDLGIDWKVIELEYLKGMRVTHIASTYKIKQCTLEARIRRMGWKTKRLTMESAIANKEAQKTIQTLATKAGSYLERVVKQVDKGMDVLEELGVDDRIVSARVIEGADNLQPHA